MSSPVYNQVRNRILATPCDTYHSDPVRAKLDGLFKTAEVFVSTNVTEYYFAGTDQEFWHLDEHFPNLAPPFDSFFIETKAPTHVRSETHGVTQWHRTDIKPHLGELKRPIRWGAWFMNVSVDSYLSMDYAKLALPTPDSMWLYGITLFAQYEEHEPAGTIWHFALAVDKETGKPIKNPSPLHEGIDDYSLMSFPLGAMRRVVEDMEDAVGNSKQRFHNESIGRDIMVSVEGAYSSEAIGLLKPLLLAISFMHCKNVERIANYPSPKLNKKRVSRNLPPICKFHTLHIEPMKKIIQQAVDAYRGVRGKTDIKMALHRVRGHFKTYTADKPLLGHAVGSWFWASQARGTKKRGVVVKEYEVEKGI
jgi:hypothetical protein